MKDILVHLDGSDHDKAVLAAAMIVAARRGARLTALFARNDTDRASMVARQPSAHLRLAAAEAARFFESASCAEITTRWWQLPHGVPDTVTAETTFCARFFDLVVVGQHATASSHVPGDFVEHLILNCGRPVLVIPYVGIGPSLGERVVVAWNGDREASRAMHDSLPLLVAAKVVTVLSLRATDGSNAQGEMVGMPAVDVLDHLRANGVVATGERAPSEEIGKMDMLLSRVCDLGADLLVMGADGHSVLSALKGTSTRSILRHMTVPVLMAH